MSFNDRKHCGLLALTGSASGHITDLENLLLKTTVTTPPSQLNDMWHTYWDGEFIPKGHFNDRAQTWLDMIGYGHGTLSESWYAFWVAACDGDIGTLPSFNLIFPLSWSLQGRVDTVPIFANFTRAAGPSTVEDFEGVIHSCLDGEARFWRARRVENLYTGNSNTIDILTFPVVEGERYQVSIFGGNVETSRIGVQGFGFDGLVNAEFGLRGDYIQAVNATGTGDVELIIIAGTPINIMVEIVPAHIFDASLQYVSVGVESAPWHGANVDGVQYFPTDRDGAPLQGMRGCLVEEANTNELTEGLDISNAGFWTVSAGDLPLVDSDATPPPYGKGYRYQTGTNVVQEHRISGTGTNSGPDVPDDTAFCIGGFFRAVEGSTAQEVRIQTRTNADASQWKATFFNLTTGVARAIPAGVIPISIPYPNGWWWLGEVIESSEVGVPVNNTFQFHLAKDNGVTFDGTGTETMDVGPSGYYISGHFPTYVPSTGNAKGTRPVETLNVLRPAVLLQPVVNDILIAMRDFIVGDRNSIPATVISMIAQGSTNQNLVRFRKGAIHNFGGGSVGDGVTAEGVVLDDGLSKVRSHILTLSSIDGVSHTLNGVAENDPVSPDILTMDLGDGIIHVGTSTGGAQHLSAGISMLAILDQS